MQTAAPFSSNACLIRCLVACFLHQARLMQLLIGGIASPAILTLVVLLLQGPVLLPHHAEQCAAAVVAGAMSLQQHFRERLAAGVSSSGQTLATWTTKTGQDPSVTLMKSGRCVAWQPLDADGCPISGSLAYCALQTLQPGCSQAIESCNMSS